MSRLLDYMERLQRLATDNVSGVESHPTALDQKALALVRLAALVAVGGAVPSYGAQVDAAIDAGATAEEIVDTLVGVVPIIGLPSVVAAAPKLAMALGFDTEAAM
jgi:4-carboxymuconolactone decarboxylase